MLSCTFFVAFSIQTCQHLFEIVIFSILEMTSTDDSTSISSMMIESDASQDPLNDAPTPSETEELRQTVENYEDNEQDEGINDEPQLDDDEDEVQITPSPSTDTKIPIMTSTLKV
jgi:hypothetical protein